MNIYGITFSQIEQYLIDIKEKTNKAPFITKALYRQKIDYFNDMTDVKKSIKNKMTTDFKIQLPKIITQLESCDSYKFLFELEDNNLIETVVMKQKYGNSICVSTQIGCNMGCTFCQSGRQKKIRNLEVFEITSQILAVEKILNLKIDNVVLMGIGEPFDNYNNTMDFLSILSNPNMFGIGKRHISVSSCGLAPSIYDYAKHNASALLAISLHAPNDELRNNLMPINKTYPLNKLFDAIDYYISSCNKKVMLEYVMLKNVNDQASHAEELSRLIGNRKCHVNIIPYNDTQNLGFEKSSFDQIMKFYDVLKKNGVSVTMRREIGSSVNAACGQLRSKCIDKI